MSAIKSPSERLEDQGFLAALLDPARYELVADAIRRARPVSEGRLSIYAVMRFGIEGNCKSDPLDCPRCILRSAIEEIHP